MTRGIERGLDYLARVQRSDGAWLPLWFGNQEAPGDENPTYGTARVLLALQVIGGEKVGPMQRRGTQWLLTAQNADGGWGGDKNVPSSIEETALALSALNSEAKEDTTNETLKTALHKGRHWLARQTENGQEFAPSPIGFYFAKLWYFEPLYPLIFTVGSLIKQPLAEPAE